ncbi:tRNA (adenosine(37)-N6)-dimethylallyltransferase MiaA [Cognatishimia activa]|uniref:tRNA dimethylallyltransferase n=1 Tax=Cognatishimia activa TaxID=1715691 RepID=A0A975EPA1_9RHOB|nr:tRNA (adenosine(37)-N6)-dimethylallyltransferase MiaA [Cognatishimia activa]QTN35813.1 tRNA (adenosine(37)-N6)-dimethylallyltransferase MiaA [Cognatishimia activa]
MRDVRESDALDAKTQQRPLAVIDLSKIPSDKHVLIAGPTASGKSALALEIAAKQGGVIVNADALQIYDNWPILSARPNAEDEAAAPHRLYGHISGDQAYSVGHWLREIKPILASERAIIVGGTGLYFTALTEGLAEIPATPDATREEANLRVKAEGFESLRDELDEETLRRIDVQNPMRVQRAWEVLRATGRHIWDWQDQTPPPLLNKDQYVTTLMMAEKDWLNARIEQRFDLMIKAGALDEARANLKTWDPKAPSAKTIGASELIRHVLGELSLDRARELTTILTRQYAKRQRTWFKSRMSHWEKCHLPIRTDR